MPEGGGNFWWEKEIPRLRAINEDLSRRLERMGTWGPERRRVLDEKAAMQYELENALRAAESHEQAVKRTRNTPSVSGRQMHCRLEAEEPPRSWSEVEISFLSDERVEIRLGTTKRWTYNFGEMGFQDRRSGKQNLAWTMLSLLAGQNGTLPQPAAGKRRAMVQKRIQELRTALRCFFGIESDPIPFNGVTYQVSFKIDHGPSFET